jgi:hypothetical protein
LKPHNNVEIAVYKRLKLDRDNSKFQTFTDNFKKQGGDEDLDFPPYEEEKIEIKKPETQGKRKRGCPNKVIVQDQKTKKKNLDFL